MRPWLSHFVPIRYASTKRTIDDQLPTDCLYVHGVGRSVHCDHRFCDVVRNDCSSCCQSALLLERLTVENHDRTRIGFGVKRVIPRVPIHVLHRQTNIHNSSESKTGY